MSAEVDALRTAINNDLAVVQPQIRGNQSMGNDAMKPDAVAATQARLQRLQQRETVDKAALAALDALDQDQFPSLPPAQVPQSVLDEIGGDKSDVNAAAGGFVLNSVSGGTVAVTDFADLPPKP